MAECWTRFLTGAVTSRLNSRLCTFTYQRSLHLACRALHGWLAYRANDR
jgi:hypothetical protein